MRMFGGDVDTVLGECESCGRVLKVPRASATETPAGFTIPALTCPCGRVHARITRQPPPVQLTGRPAEPPVNVYYPLTAEEVAAASPPSTAPTKSHTRAPILAALALIAVACVMVVMVARSCAAQPRARALPTSAVSGPEYVPLLGHLFNGVKVYQGATHEYRFTVLGGSANCARMPSGKGVKVKYADGTLAWLDRDFLISGNFYARADDSAASSFMWSDLPGCN